MYVSYADYAQNKSGSLWQSAHNLRRESGRDMALSPFIFMTDPKRIEDIAATARKLPKGAAIIYRHFGAADKDKVGQDLRAIDGLQLLIGNDPVLAARLGADGVHMPRSTPQDEISKIRADHPDWIITQAAPKTGPLPDNQGLDALFVSAVFPSRSPSAGEPIGLDRLTQIAGQSLIPVYALGGINTKNAPKLAQSGVAGLASINGIIKEIVMAEIKVEDTSYGHRFVYRREGHEEAELTMRKLKPRRGGDVFSASHTGVPKSMGGQGVGKALIKIMSEHAHENGYKVVPTCPFVAAMFKRNPSWAEGVAV